MMKIKKSTPKIQLLIWDCDGVLVDSEHIAAKAFYNIIVELGGSITQFEVYNSLKGGSIYKAIDYVKEQVKVPESFHIEQEYRRRSFELFKTDLKAVDGVENILTEVNTIQCIASNGPPNKIIHNLEVTDLLKHFEPEYIFSGHDIQKFKPDPALFLYVAESCGYEPHECLVIEDSEQGAHAALKAGMACFGFAAETHADIFLQLKAQPFYHMSELQSELGQLGLLGNK